MKACHGRGCMYRVTFVPGSEAEGWSRLPGTLLALLPRLPLFGSLACTRDLLIRSRVGSGDGRARMGGSGRCPRWCRCGIGLISDGEGREELQLGCRPCFWFCKETCSVSWLAGTFICHRAVRLRGDYFTDLHRSRSPLSPPPLLPAPLRPSHRLTEMVSPSVRPSPRPLAS